MVSLKFGYSKIKIKRNYCKTKREHRKYRGKVKLSEVSTSFLEVGEYGWEVRRALTSLNPNNRHVINGNKFIAPGLVIN